MNPFSLLQLGKWRGNKGGGVTECAPDSKLVESGQFLSDPHFVLGAHQRKILLLLKRVLTLGHSQEFTV